MAFCDFVVRYDPQKDTERDVALRILYSIFVKRIKGKKPAVAGVFGASGEGKSITSCTLQETLLEIQGIDAYEYFSHINIHTPLQYPQKMDKLLYEKELKKVNIVALHEAREVIPAKDWHTFVSRAISDVNAMSRAVKPLITLIISQSIRDITTDMRRTLNYKIDIRRPLHKAARAYFNVMWIDERDLEKPRLKRRKLSGYLVYPSGKYRRVVPSYLEIPKPDPRIVELFEKEDFESKKGILKNKMNELLEKLQQEAGDQEDKVDKMVQWYMKHLDQLQQIGRRYRGRWKLKPDAKELHNLDRREARRFESKLNEKLKEHNLLDSKGNLEVET